MKNTVLLAMIGAALSLSLVGCGDKQSDLNKAIADSHEMSRRTSGVDQEMPRVVIAPDSPASQQKGGK